MKPVAVLALLLVMGCATERPLIGNRTIADFREAKRRLRELYAAHPETLYCGCRFDKALHADLTSCGYTPKNNTSRSRRVEWEHAVPSRALGRSRNAWRFGHPDCVNRKGKRFRGRKCAVKVDRTFRLAEADMHNLFPALGELNARRSTAPMADIPGEAREFGACDVEIHDGRFEPRPAVRGDLARAHLYMDRSYPELNILRADERRTMERWSTSDPVDGWECERARRIASVQGNENPFVSEGCRPLIAR